MILCGVVFTVCSPFGARGDTVSQAEQKTFLDDHLANVVHTESIEYKFRRSGSMDTPFEDRVVMSVRPGEGTKGKTVDTQYLSGEHRVELPRVEDARGNPVILYFLEADVREMHERTGGSANYFRKRIRLALAEAADIHPVKVDFEGRSIPGDEILIRPFHNDALREKFSKFEEKAYVLTLAEQVPGGVYSIRSEVPGAGDASPALLEVLTFDRVGKVGPIHSENP
jgi:hypothetical protein